MERFQPMTPNSMETDEKLVEKFLTGEPSEAEDAFEVLMARHGPMVMGVCRQTASHRQDAEDAFQATFLSLARKACTIRDRRLLGPWLHAVAYRTASRIRARTARRRALVLSGEEVSPRGENGDLDRGELERMIHVELDRLPENYRTAAVQCYLEGKTCAQAARLLGRPVGTIKGQLSRARGLLRYRLRRHGGEGIDLLAEVHKAPVRQPSLHRLGDSPPLVHPEESMESSSRGW
jgi:RNA polymerase sigma factor (sigma-70 family)